MSRQTILRLLLAQPEGAYLSGERLSEELHITRAAIWKGIQALREEGYDIESRTRLGYRLLSAPEKMTPEAIGARLSTRTVGRRILCFAQLDSTNTYAKQAAQEGGEDGLVIIADEQTGGRGRLGRVFHSPKKGLYLTALLKPDLPPWDVIPVTALAAVAAMRAVERTCGVCPGIKWTNDLVLNGRKIAGILTEMGVEGESGALQYVVVGIGINANETAEDFGPELESVAASLAMETGKAVNRTDLAAALIEELDRLRAALGGDMAAYLRAYRENCVTLGRDVRILRPGGGARTGRAVSIDESFALVVEYEDGTRETIRSGEVSVRGLCGYVSKGASSASGGRSADEAPARIFGKRTFLYTQTGMI